MPRLHCISCVAMTTYPYVYTANAHADAVSAYLDQNPNEQKLLLIHEHVLSLIFCWLHASIAESVKHRCGVSVRLSVPSYANGDGRRLNEVYRVAYEFVSVR